MPPPTCEICGSPQIRSVEIRAALVYQLCSDCGHCVQGTGSSSAHEIFEESQKRYFGSGTVLVEASESLIERESLEQRCRIFSRFVSCPSRVLEVGPGAGIFLRWAHKLGHSITAVEESRTLALALGSLGNTDVIIDQFETSDLPSASCDVFCSFHVIEHVPDPRAHLSVAARVTRPGGLAFIATPNSRSWQQALFCKLSPNFDSAHLRVFSLASLKALAREAGWSVLLAETPEYSSGWPRVITKAIRRIRSEDEESTAGKYATSGSGPMRWAFRIFSAATWPLRSMQARSLGGNEIFLVLQRNVESSDPIRN